MNTKDAALNERASQELASIQADIDNGRAPEAYQRKVDYLTELVEDLPRERQAHFYAEIRRLKLNPKVTQAGVEDIHAPAPPPQDDPNKPDQSQQPGGPSPA